MGLPSRTKGTGTLFLCNRDLQQGGIQGHHDVWNGNICSYNFSRLKDAFFNYILMLLWDNLHFPEKVSSQ